MQRCSMKPLIVILLPVFLAYAKTPSQDENLSLMQKPILTKFQKRKLSIARERAAKEEEARKLEEEGFCPCSVQMP